MTTANVWSKFHRHDLWSINLWNKLTTLVAVNTPLKKQKHRQSLKFGTKFSGEVPLFLELPKFHYNVKSEKPMAAVKNCKQQSTAASAWKISLICSASLTKLQLVTETPDHNIHYSCISKNISTPSVLWHCWLGVRKSIQPVRVNVMRCWCGCLPGARCRLFAYGPADATAIPKPHHLLPHLNPDWFYLSATGLPWLSWRRGR